MPFPRVSEAVWYRRAAATAWQGAAQARRQPRAVRGAPRRGIRPGDARRRDVAAAVYAWMHEVACAPDEDEELCWLIDWLFGVWRAFATQLPLERLAHEALGDSEARELWEVMRARVFRWRFLNESRDRLKRCEAAERLLPQFERGVLRSGWAAVSSEAC